MFLQDTTQKEMLLKQLKSSFLKLKEKLYQESNCENGKATTLHESSFIWCLGHEFKPRNLTQIFHTLKNYKEQCVVDEHQGEGVDTMFIYCDVIEPRVTDSQKLGTIM